MAHAVAVMGVSRAQGPRTSSEAVVTGTRRRMPHPRSSRPSRLAHTANRQYVVVATYRSPSSPPSPIARTRPSHTSLTPPHRPPRRRATRPSRPLVRRVRDRRERRVLVRDLVHGREERELVLEPLHLEDVVDLLGRQRALQLLAAQQLRLDLVEALRLVRRRKRLRALAVAAAKAGGDEIGDTAALEEGVVL